MSISALFTNIADAAAAAHGKLPIKAATRPDPESFETYAQHDLRDTGEALSRLAKDLPFMGPLKKYLALFIRTLHSPLLKPFEVLNLLTNNMFSGLAPGFADKAYELAYKVLPTGLISKATEKIGGGGGVSKLLIAGLGKVGINTDDDNIKALINELVKGLSDIYDPKFLKQFGNFFTSALEKGNVAYLELADALITRALSNIGYTATKALSQGMSTIGDGTAQAAVTEAIKDTAQIVDGSKQASNKAKPSTSQATQNTIPQTQKPATGKKAQDANNKPKPGFLANVLSSISNIPSKIAGIFPKAAPAAA